MGMLGGQGQQQQYGSSSSMKGTPSYGSSQQSMKGMGSSQMGNQSAPGYGQGYYSNQQPFSSGITNQYTQQPQGLYTGGPPQAQGYNGQGQGFNGQMGPQAPGSSQTNPTQQIGFGGMNGGPGMRIDPIARNGGGGNSVFPASLI